MKRLFLFSVLAFGLVSFSVGSFAQQDGAKQMLEQPGKTGKTMMVNKGDRKIVLTGTAVETLQIQALNVKERLVVLADMEGNLVDVVEVDDDVKGFDKLAIGDIVTIEYYESLALQVAAPTAEPLNTQDFTVVTEDTGKGKPGKIEVEIVSEVVEVIGIDRATNMLKYKAPGKQVARVKVDPSVSTMDNLKPGEKVLVTYTEATAVSVAKP